MRLATGHQALRDAVDDIAPNLERAAATENAHVFNQARIHGLAHVTGLRVQWDATLDARVCDDCLELDGEKSAPMEGFVVPSTGQVILHPPAHPYCRCVVLTLDEE